MTRTFTVEQSLQGHALSSFDAAACEPGDRARYRAKPERRDPANPGSPVVRW
jgi:hypothetical protein